MENADGMLSARSNGTQYSFTDPEIAAKDLDKTIYVAAVYECDGTTYAGGVLAYSLDAYCQEHAANTASAMNEIAIATAVYGNAAKTYFAN